MKNTATAGSMMFDTITLQEVMAPSANGVTINSFPNNGSLSWSSIDPLFNWNDGAGYTYHTYGKQ